VGTPEYSRSTARVTGVHDRCGTAEGCTGAYISGAAGSNECPAGSVRIEAEAACRAAAAATGKAANVPFVETISSYPRGCYYYTIVNTAYFNTDPVGAGKSGYQLLCAAVTTTGARTNTPPPQFARVCTVRYSQAVCVIIIKMAYI
jgi:hypothetical protein